MSHPAQSTTVLWVAILTACEDTTMDLSAAEPTHRECAEQMRAAGILEEPETHHYTLSSNGMKLLMLVENLRDYSLGIN